MILYIPLWPNNNIFDPTRNIILSKFCDIQRQTLNKNHSTPSSLSHSTLSPLKQHCLIHRASYQQATRKLKLKSRRVPKHIGSHESWVILVPRKSRTTDAANERCGAAIAMASPIEHQMQLTMARFKATEGWKQKRGELWQATGAEWKGILAVEWWAWELREGLSIQRWRWFDRRQRWR